jgi:hypothetical protein
LIFRLLDYAPAAEPSLLRSSSRLFAAHQKRCKRLLCTEAATHVNRSAVIDLARAIASSSSASLNAAVLAAQAFHVSTKCKIVHESLQFRPVVRLGMAAVGLFFMGQFALFTYLRPFLETVTQVDGTSKKMPFNYDEI